MRGRPAGRAQGAQRAAPPQAPCSLPAAAQVESTGVLTCAEILMSAIARVITRADDLLAALNQEQTGGVGGMD